MKHLYCIAIICTALLRGNLYSQSEILDIWQGHIPGAISQADYDFIADSGGSWTYMRHITSPLLDFYPAAPGHSNGTAVIICPGGGYWALAFKHEGYEVAKWLNTLGISAFVLKYRLPDDAIMEDKTIGPLQDAQEALRLVRRHAAAWNIKPGKIGIMGFSAGGHLASTLSAHFNEKVYESPDTTSARPDFSILIYPVISMDSTITHKGSRNFLLGDDPSEELVNHFSNELQVTDRTPPAFLVHSLDDGTVPVQNSINYALEMKNNGIPCELHIYESGGHGYGLGRTSNTESTWPEACKVWLKTRGFL
jgi:acetyl esterase/lipase